MARTSTPRIAPKRLREDHDILLTLQTLADYSPTDSAASIEALQSLAAEVKRARDAEVIARRAYEVAREQAIAAEIALHRAILVAKLQVLAQYGEDSPAVHAVGRKRKSERRRAAAPPTKA